MARNGSGTYSLPQAPFVPNSTIASAAVNSDLSDIAAALTQSISKDGQTVYTGNQPMGDNKLTGLGNGTTATDSVNVGQVTGGQLIYGGVAGGTADAITLTPSPGIAAYAVGQRFSYKVALVNTTALTASVNGIGAGPVVWADGTALVAGDTPAGAMVEIIVKDISTPTAPIFHLQTVATPPLTTARAVAGKVYIQTFTGNGTYTPHAGMVNCIIEAVGGGGGGGGTASAAATLGAGGGGGGAGGRTVTLATATDIGVSKTVTIGAAGAAGTAGNNAGGAGGDTSVGSLCIAKGGTGGGGNSGTGGAAPTGGAGGVAGTGTIAATGQPGLTSTNTENQHGVSGAGGSGPYGGGGVGKLSGATSAAGAAGTGYGAGGSGGASFDGGGTAAGGVGTAGFVVVTEYCNQ